MKKREQNDRTEWFADRCDSEIGLLIFLICGVRAHIRTRRSGLWLVVAVREWASCNADQFERDDHGKTQRRMHADLVQMNDACACDVLHISNILLCEIS